METKKNENAAVAAMRAGFTLMEILVAVAIIGILATVATSAVMENLSSARIMAAQDSVRTLYNGVVSYQMKKGRLPSSLEDLVKGSDEDPPVIEGGEGVLLDPWETEYKYERKGKRVTILSAGPDAEWGTEDDISSAEVGKKKK